MMQLLWQSLRQSFTQSANQTVDQRQRSTSGFGTLTKVALIALAVGAVSRPAQAFDTGHHFDLTREAMQDRGFGNTAIEVAQLENWLTDYYSSSPTSSIKSEVGLLHFDNLLNTQQVSNYWGHFTINTRNAVQQATRDRDALKLLTVMGISLHAVQDFYTHSNWVELRGYSPSLYQTASWFDAPPSSSQNVFTGVASSFPGTPPPGHPKHGGYDDGLNKDEYGKPLWDQSYVYAFAASREWVNAIQTWVSEVDPSFWSTVQSFNVTGGDRSKLNDDLEALYRISEWVKAGSENGHWKGRGSGSRSEFLAFAAAWVAKPDGRFVSEFKDKKTYRLLSNGLTGNTPPTTAVPVVPKLATNHRAVIVRTLKVSEKGDVGTFETKIDPLGKADFFARITVAGQTFVEAMQLDRSSVTPAWTTIKFIPNSLAQVPIRYQLWDEDGVGRGDDDHVDINPRTGTRDLNLTFVVNTHNLSGDVTGIYDAQVNPVNIAGAKPDGDRGVLQFYVTERSLQPAPTNGRFENRNQRQDVFQP